MEEIIAHKRVELEQQKQMFRPEHLEARLAELIETGELPEAHSMRQSLSQSATGIIAEFKRRSPSKGWIKQDADSSVIPPSYQQAGASALSILTDEEYFGGSLKDIRHARPKTHLPILRKDFVVDRYQLLQAKTVEADTVLLIAAALTPQLCRALAKEAHELKMEVLLEIHAEHEMEFVNEYIDMVGVNNRNLGTFHTDVENSFRLAEKLPKEFLLVSESGISSPDTVKQLREAGFRGFLIGETFMRTENPAATLAEFIKAVQS